MSPKTTPSAARDSFIRRELRLEWTGGSCAAWGAERVSGASVVGVAGCRDAGAALAGLGAESAMAATIALSSQSLTLLLLASLSKPGPPNQSRAPAPPVAGRTAFRRGFSARPEQREGVAALLGFGSAHLLDVRRAAEVLAHDAAKRARPVAVQHETDRLALAEQAVEARVEMGRRCLDPDAAQV